MENKDGENSKQTHISTDSFEVDFSPLNDVSNGHTSNTHSDINASSVGGANALRCGYCSWQPDWLQRCNNPRMLLAAICWFTFTQGFVCNGLVLVNLSPWERLFELRSHQTAWIVSTYDFTAAIFTLVFGYLGQHVHNGRILSVGALVMAAGSLTMLLPHLLAGSYQLGPVPIETCDVYDNGTAAECNLKETSAYFWFLILGQCFHGIGGSAVFTLAVPYMDTQIKSRNTPLYIGIMQGFAALGPAAGYMLGGLFLSVYVDYGKNLGKVELEPSDPRWVGAWWMGLVFSSFASLTVAAVIACFPRELPSARLHKEDKSAEAYHSNVASGRKQGRHSHDHVLSTTKSILQNRVLVLLSLAGIIESGMVNAFGAFLPKLLQFQFGQSPVMAAVYTGAVIVPGAAGGQIIGGIIPKVFNFKMRGLIAQCAVTALLGAALSFQVLLRCDTPPIAGVTVPYPTSHSSSVLDSANIYHECNGMCNCSSYTYDPVCGQDGLQYFSPCFAGCVHSTEINNEKYFYDCPCVSASNSSALHLPALHTWSERGVVGSGVCEADCPVFYVFMVLFLCMCLCTFICATAGQAASLRAVTDNERTLSVGMQNSFYRMGNIPTPILFGLIFDKACLQWQESCEVTGSCWIYDTVYVSRGLFLICLVVKLLSTLAFTLAFLTYGRKATYGQRNESVVSLLNHIGDKLGRYDYNSDSDSDLRL